MDGAGSPVDSLGVAEPAPPKRRAARVAVGAGDDRRDPRGADAGRGRNRLPGFARLFALRAAVADIAIDRGDHGGHTLSDYDPHTLAAGGVDRDGDAGADEAATGDGDPGADVPGARWERPRPYLLGGYDGTNPPPYDDPEYARARADVRRRADRRLLAAGLAPLGGYVDPVKEAPR